MSEKEVTKAKTKLEKEALKEAKELAIKNEVAIKRVRYGEKMKDYLDALDRLKVVEATVKELEDLLDIKPDEKKQLFE